MSINYYSSYRATVQDISLIVWRLCLQVSPHLHHALLIHVIMNASWPGPALWYDSYIAVCVDNILSSVGQTNQLQTSSAGPRC